MYFCEGLNSNNNYLYDCREKEDAENNVHTFLRFDEDIQDLPISFSFVYHDTLEMECLSILLQQIDFLVLWMKDLIISASIKIAILDGKVQEIKFARINNKDNAKDITKNYTKLPVLIRFNSFDSLIWLGFIFSKQKCLFLFVASY